MKLKAEYLEEIKNQFEQDWNTLQENLKQEVQGVKFSDVFDLTERILADENMKMEYSRIFQEANLWTKFNESDLYVRKNTESIVREYNRLYDNLSYIFNDDGQCNIIKFTSKGSRNQFTYYLVTTDDLYNMDEYTFTLKIVSRLFDKDIADIEYKSLGIDDYMKLMNLIASRKSYDSGDDFTFFKDNLYNEFYDSVEGFEDMDLFSKFTVKDLEKHLKKEYGK